MKWIRRDLFPQMILMKNHAVWTIKNQLSNNYSETSLLKDALNCSALWHRSSEYFTIFPFLLTTTPVGNVCIPKILTNEDSISEIAWKLKNVSAVNSFIFFSSSSATEAHEMSFLFLYGSAILFSCGQTGCTSDQPIIQNKYLPFYRFIRILFAF